MNFQNKIWWLWLPLMALVVQAVLEVSLPAAELAVLLSETGPHEMIQFLLAFFGFLAALRILMMPQLKTLPFLYAWVGIAALGTLYIAGEEMSWGQHVLEWNTPEYWAAINDQGETNLHNTSSWLDQKPRLLLEIGVLVGGVIIPFLLRHKPSTLDFVPHQYRIIFPSCQLMVIAFIALGIKIFDKIDEALEGVVLAERISEVEEVFLFYFVLLYLIGLKRKLAQG